MTQPKLATQNADARYYPFPDSIEHRLDMPRIDRIGVLNLKEDSCELVEYPLDLDVFQVFIALRDVWRWQNPGWHEHGVPSVTTILSALNKPALVPAARKIASEVALERFPEWIGMIWEGRMNDARMAASRAAKKVWDDRAAVGTMVHAAIEARLLFPAQETIVEPVCVPYCEQFDKWMAASEFTPMFSEVTVYSDRFAYAGTVDLIGTIGDDTYLLDVKTGGNWPEHQLQLVSYANADFLAADAEPGL